MQQEHALTRAHDRFERALGRLEQSSAIGRQLHIRPLLDSALYLMRDTAGVAYVYDSIGRVTAAGVFEQSDWAHPDRLRPELVTGTLLSGAAPVALELLSLLRLLACVESAFDVPEMPPAAARAHLEQVLALNLGYLFPGRGEADRILAGAHGPAIRCTFGFIVERLGFSAIHRHVVAEAEGALAQRPIQVDSIKRLLAELQRSLPNPDARAARLIDAAFRPSPLAASTPDIAAYRDALVHRSYEQLATEASMMATHIVRTGLVSEYHAILLRHVNAHVPDLVESALGLSATGAAALASYRQLCHRLIDECVHPETAQAVYGMHALLERGVLYLTPVPHALWRQIVHPIRDDVQQALLAAYGDAVAPRMWLLAGITQVLGQPLGVGQGDNPTCQSARAISLWSQCDPGYLLQLLLWATRDGEIFMRFEGDYISSRYLSEGLLAELHPALDPVSLVLVPHLDRLYAEMWRRADGRGLDPHRWINPAFHGWWVPDGFTTCVEPGTGAVVDYEQFVRRFYAAYHPYYNGNQPVIYPQPAGIAATTPQGLYIGAHAISIQRVALDPTGTMRVYFHNPNNEGRQDWGHDVITMVRGNGEFSGESSLPVTQFVARLYLFHYDPMESGEPERVPAAEITEIAEMARNSWAANRAWQ
jgi:hypothetical protein